MNKLLIIVVLAVALTGCHRSNRMGTKTDREESGLKGEVRTVRTESAKLIKKDGEWVETSPGLPEVKAYDADGQESEETHLGADDALMLKITFAYAEDGKKQEKRALMPNGTELGSTAFTYNDKGQIIESVDYRNRDGLQSKSAYAYDEAGRRTEWTRTNTRGAVIDKWAYNYDGKGNRSEETRFYADGSIDTQCVYMFDAGGNPIEAAKYKQGGLLTEKEQYTYEFDRADNWTKKTTSRWLNGSAGADFQPVEIIHRTISYY